MKNDNFKEIDTAMEILASMIVNYLQETRSKRTSIQAEKKEAD